MAVSEDLQLVELVAARLCHDLVGPIGAIANGAELLGDGGALDVEVVALIGESARRASRRLQIYRVAYGTAASLSSSHRLDEARRLVQALLEDQASVTLDWPAPDAAIESAAGRLAIKVTLVLVLIALELLPRGGTIAIHHAAPRPGRIAFEITARGTPARLPEELQSVFNSGTINLATPKAVPALLALRLARAADGSLTVEASGGEVVKFSAEIAAGV